MAPHSRHFRHPSLDTFKRQIRLLQLRKRARRHRTPKFDLHVFDIADAPPCVALSYTWGDPQPTHKIRVNHERFAVRQNLYNILTAYHVPEYMWIDQICIDQDDMRERSHQVNMMSEIYKDCEYVVVWLGGATSKSRKAADRCHRKPHWRSMNILLQDVYSTRLWIIQELILAREARLICRILPNSSVKIHATNC